MAARVARSDDMWVDSSKVGNGKPSRCCAGMEAATIHGIDAGGITRHISRAKQQHPLLSEPTTPRSWIWVVKSMWGSSDRLEVNLLDTLVISSGSIAGWFFTGKDGCVMKKSEKHCGSDHIKEVFGGLHESFPKKASDLFCVTYSSEGAPSVSGPGSSQ